MNHYSERIQTALDAMTQRPRSLLDYLRQPGPDFDAASEADLDTMLSLILDPDPNGLLRIKFANQLHSWDNTKDGDWIGDSPRNTSSRRARIHELLKSGKELAKRIDTLLPYFHLEEPLIIAEAHQDWYAPSLGVRDYYWRRYISYLTQSRGWSQMSALNLENSTRSILECISNPESETAYSSRGLVMGYVQSGKTTNFAGVVARAADAGYRLIIVLAGTWNILRNQTQRRFDKELLGQELLENDESYQNPHPVDWDEFLVHGAHPTDLGHYSWQRMTRPDIDFKGLKAAIDSLEYEKRFKQLPLYPPDNLHHLPVKLLVVKKNSSVLEKLAGDLLKMKPKLAEIPALVIDDESDQAGLNTVDPSKVKRDKVDKNVKERTATNAAIVRLLGLLPRGQYVGYSATPYANALVNPDDPEDLFPRDFIVSLDRPAGYMGISDFFDPLVDYDDLVKEDFSQPELAFIRRVAKSHLEDDEDLKCALRSYVLAGAIKLYRCSCDPVNYKTAQLKHHTMLIHTSSRKGAHSSLAQRIIELWDQCAFNSPDSLIELQRLWELDFLKVCNAHLPQELVPTSFGDLKPHLSEAVKKITRDSPFVRVVNSEKDEAPDFTKGPVWNIIIGGNKLSRGYTVEGLTISYYRRVTNTADTLMQMGRWFGFRHGYRDLVRVFLGVKEGKTQSLDLVVLFKEVCRMEERFREEITRYVRHAGAPKITPSQVPPLIAISGNLPPTARNKMFNAQVDTKNFGGRWSMLTLTAKKKQSLDYNHLATTTLLKASNCLKLDCLDGHIAGALKAESIPALVFKTKSTAIVQFLTDYRWLESNYVHPSRPTDVTLQIEFLTNANHGITSWLIIAPQRQKSFGRQILLHDQLFAVKQRSRVGDRFKVFGESTHRRMAEFLAGISIENGPAVINPSPDLKSLASIHQGVMLLYPVREAIDGPVSIGFELLFPKNDLPYEVGFKVISKSHASSVIVPKTDLIEN